VRASSANRKGSGFRREIFLYTALSSVGSWVPGDPRSGSKVWEAPDREIGKPGLHVVRSVHPSRPEYVFHEVCAVGESRIIGVQALHRVIDGCLHGPGLVRSASAPRGRVAHLSPVLARVEQVQLDRAGGPLTARPQPRLAMSSRASKFGKREGSPWFDLPGASEDGETLQQVWLRAERSVRLGTAPNGARTGKRSRLQDVVVRLTYIQHRWDKIVAFWGGQESGDECGVLSVLERKLGWTEFYSDSRSEIRTKRIGYPPKT